MLTCWESQYSIGLATPDGTSYELLYCWPLQGERANRQHTQLKHELAELGLMQAAEIRQHYKETEDLMARCELRQKQTEREVR